jgi:hypothetical protein
VVTNLLRPERGVDTNHAGAPSSCLTGVPPKRTAGPDFSLGATLDQVVAQEIGQERRCRRSSSPPRTSPA